MKRLIVLIAVILTPSFLKADGGPNVYIYLFSITKTNNQVIKGYSYVIGDHFNEDSLKSSEHLKRFLDQSQKDWKKRDSLTYYKGRIKFEYNDLRNNSEPTKSLYTLTDKSTLSHSSIRSIKIDTVMNHFWGTAIQTDLKLVDTIWLKKKPIKKIGLDGYLCYFQIFIFETSTQINDIVKKIEILQKEAARLKVENENGHSDESPLMYDNMDEIEQQYFRLLREFNGLKVVIVEECSC